MIPPLMALLAWFPIAVVFFYLLRAEYAVCVSLVGGILLLPELYSLDVPGLPELGKIQLVSLATLLAAVVSRGRTLWAAKPARGLEAVALVSAIGALGTVATNREAIGTSPALEWWDALGLAFSDVVNLAVPFFLGRAFFRSPQSLARMWQGLVVLALCYAPLVMFELRVSPQLNSLVYGYYQHSFAQTIRDGGWRPMVFMQNGLALCLYIALATLGATALTKVRAQVLGASARWSAAALGVLLLLCQSAAAIVWAVITVIPMALLPARRQQLIASGLALGVAVYLPLRMLGWVPVDSMLRAASGFGAERSGSLAVRLRSESYLLSHALEKPWFGWGGFNRSRYVSAPDVMVDGCWIIRFGMQGIVGYVGLYCLMLLPIWQARSALRYASPVAAQILAGTSLAVGMSAADTIPNGLFNQIGLFLAGSLSGTSMAILTPGPSMARLRSRRVAGGRLDRWGTAKRRQKGRGENNSCSALAQGTTEAASEVTPAFPSVDTSKPGQGAAPETGSNEVAASSPANTANHSSASGAPGYFMVVVAKVLQGTGRPAFGFEVPTDPTAEKSKVYQ